MATRTISTPDPGFSGSRAGVVFRDGRGEVDEGDTAALAYFARHGYAVETRPIPTKKERSSAAAEKAAASTSSEGDPPDA